MTGPSLDLHSGASRALLAPQSGGCIAGWWLDGQPMLRSGDLQAAASPIAMASFPLVPYSNRITGGVFRLGDRSIAIAQSMPQESDPIHGVGFLRAWHAAQLDDASATLTLDHQGDARWPWPFTAQQRICLSGDSLLIELQITNVADIPVPAAFGHHPYFDSHGARIAFAADHVWIDGVPHAPAAPFDFAGGAAVTDTGIDHCYTGWNGRARIDWVGRAHALLVTATASLPAAVLYTPPGADYFCFEPVPHRNHALNHLEEAPARAAPMPLLAPGESFTAAIHLQAVPALQAAIIPAPAAARTGRIIAGAPLGER